MIWWPDPAPGPNFDTCGLECGVRDSICQFNQFVISACNLHYAQILYDTFTKPTTNICSIFTTFFKGATVQVNPRTGAHD